MNLFISLYFIVAKYSKTSQIKYILIFIKILIEVHFQTRQVCFYSRFYPPQDREEAFAAKRFNFFFFFIND